MANSEKTEKHREGEIGKDIWGTGTRHSLRWFCACPGQDTGTEKLVEDPQLTLLIYV